MSDAFAGKVVLITGGARNLGRAMGVAFAAEGASIAINARTQRPELAQTLAAIEAAGGKAISVIGDITDRAAVDPMMAKIVEKFGRLDILVNNAVIHATKQFLDLSFEDWHAPINVTLDGAFHCTQAAVPVMIRAGGGSIVNMGGLFGHMPIPNRAPTAAAKAGLAGLTSGARARVRGAQHKCELRRAGTGQHGARRPVQVRHDAHSVRPFCRAGRNRRHGDDAVRERRAFHHRADHPRQWRLVHE